MGEQSHLPGVAPGLGGGSLLKSPLPVDGIADLLDLHVDPPEVDVAGADSPQQQKLNESDQCIPP